MKNKYKILDRETLEIKWQTFSEWRETNFNKFILISDIDCSGDPIDSNYDMDVIYEYNNMIENWDSKFEIELINTLNRMVDKYETI